MLFEEEREAFERALLAWAVKPHNDVYYDWQTKKRVAFKVYAPTDMGIDLRIDVTLSRIDPEVLELHNQVSDAKRVIKSIIGNGETQ